MLENKLPLSTQANEKTITEHWRVGTKVPLNVYDGDRAVCQCYNPEDAARIVEAVNAAITREILDDLVQSEIDEGLYDRVPMKCESATDPRDQRLSALTAERDAARAAARELWQALSESISTWQHCHGDEFTELLAKHAKLLEESEGNV